MKVTNIDEVLKGPSVPYDKPFTYADYLNWDFGEMVEIIKGKVFRMSPAPGTKHQIICGNFYGPIWQYLKGKECSVFIAPFDVILPIENKRREKATTVVQPDICIVCNPQIIEERGCFGAPDLVVEILSPHTSKKDIQNKFEVYQEAGVVEYWVVFPKDQIVEIFVLENEKYTRKGMYTFEDSVSPTFLPELIISLADVFEKKNEI